MVIELSEDRIRRHGEGMASLRSATRHWRDRLDEAVTLESLISSRERYQEVLEKLFGFFVPIEFKLDQAEEPFGLELSERRKSSDLLLDLISLGSTKEFFDQVPFCQGIPEIETPEQVLGAIFVLEQILIGGQFLCQLLQQRLGIAPESGGRFFTGYGAQTRSMWRRYCEALEDYVVTDEQRQEVIASAMETYAALICWLKSDAAESAHRGPCLCLR
jgi:heme oxygenase